MKLPEIKFVCEKCGKEQKPDLKQSNKNWSVYKSDEKCECGGDYTMSVDGEILSRTKKENNK